MKQHNQTINIFITINVNYNSFSFHDWLIDSFELLTVGEYYKTNWLN